MGSSRDNLIRILRQYILSEELKAKELANMLGRSIRHIQKCLSFDHTGEHAEFSTSEMVKLARYFSALGRNELAEQFLCENYKITQARFGQAAGCIEPHVKRLHEIAVDLSRAYLENDTSAIGQLEDELTETQANIAAEKSVMLEKLEADSRSMVEYNRASQKSPDQ